MNAYDKIYLPQAQKTLGRMLDFAVNRLGCELNDFFSLFISSGIAERFACGDFAVIAGMSGIELAYLVLELSGRKFNRTAQQPTIERSAEYWTGWALAYFQWNSGFSFKTITDAISIKEIRMLYTPYHEMDIRQFVDRMNLAFSKS